MALCSTGCGYSLAGRGSFLPGYIKTIGIPTFVNRTTVFNLETMLTQKVRAEFIGRGKYQILPQNSGVDAVLNGEVTSVAVLPSGFGAPNPPPGATNTSGLASRYTIVMTARVELRDLKENKILWDSPGVQFRQDYDSGSNRTAADPVAFFQQDTNALDRMSTEFARTIVSAILEAF